MADCLFCKMAAGEIPVDRIVENEHAFAIRDINPRAPTHLLIIPKEHIPTAREVADQHGAVMAAMFALSTEAADRAGVAEAGYRLAFNVGEAAGMTIWHLHMHLLAGRKLGPEG